MSKKNIDDLRDALFATIEGVRSGTIDVARAKVIGELSQVIVNTAVVEVKFAEATGAKQSDFLEKKPELPNGITGVHVHRITG